MNKALIWLLVAILVAIVSLPMLVPGDYGVSGPRLAPPTSEHWLGTDRLGRDVAFRSLVGFAYSLSRALLVLGMSAAVGLWAALISSLSYGGLPDRLLVIVAEAIRSLPGILLVILFAAFGIPVFFVLIVFYWSPIWRLLRNLLASQRDMPYVLAARLFGLSGFRAMLGEAFPNVWHRVLPYLPVVLAEILGVMAALEFLGIGVALDQPSLGTMLRDSIQLGFAAPWAWLPSMTLLVLIIWSLALSSDMARARRIWRPLT